MQTSQKYISVSRQEDRHNLNQRQGIPYTDGLGGEKRKLRKVPPLHLILLDLHRLHLFRRQRQLKWIAYAAATRFLSSLGTFWRLLECALDL